jgi:F0F1-type ATP synthase assembly protein I
MKMNPRDSQGLSQALSMALVLPIASLVGYGMGYGLDSLFHTGWIRYLFLALGTVAGFISLIRESNAGSK